MCRRAVRQAKGMPVVYGVRPLRLDDSNSLTCICAAAKRQVNREDFEARCRPAASATRKRSRSVQGDAGKAGRRGESGAAGQGQGKADGDRIANAGRYQDRKKGAPAKFRRLSTGQRRDCVALHTSHCSLQALHACGGHVRAAGSIRFALHCIA